VSYTWAEPFAGAAAIALRLVGGRNLTPPVAWMGGKRRYARAIADAMGVPDGRPTHVLLADAGPWGWVWPLLLDLIESARVAAVLRSWQGEHPQKLWRRLAAEEPAEEPSAMATQWLWLQARSASGLPIWWGEWRGDVSAWGFGARRPGAASHIPARQAGWASGAGSGEACLTNFVPTAPGMTHPSTLADRVEAVAASFAHIDVSVWHGSAKGVCPQPLSFCYLDPPYVGAPSYGWDCPRADVLALAHAWESAGAVVAISEAEPLEISGWHHVELTRPGGKPEWLTLSRKPTRLPERQAEMFT